LQLPIKARVRATSPTLMCDAQVKNVCVYLQHNKKEARAEGKNVSQEPGKSSLPGRFFFVFFSKKQLGFPWASHVGLHHLQDGE
jgi:hypothetical protein